MLLVELLFQISEDELDHVEVGILRNSEQDFDSILDEETLHYGSLVDCRIVHQHSDLLSIELSLKPQGRFSKEIMDHSWFNWALHEPERDYSSLTDDHEEMNGLVVTNLPQPRRSESVLPAHLLENRMTDRGYVEEHQLFSSIP